MHPVNQSLKLCAIPGDGVGQEVIPAALEILQALLPGLNVIRADAGWETFQRCGNAAPRETLNAIRSSRAALFGAVSSPSKKVDGYRSTILTIRQELGLRANIRPVDGRWSNDSRPDIRFVVVRENSECLYVGREKSDGETAIAERVITREASENIGRAALHVARQYGLARITIVHKANVLPITDGLFRDSVRRVLQQEMNSGDAIAIDEMLVDVAALRLVSQPERFGVIVTTNVFGDILSDVGANWCGGLGVAPSINLGDNIAVAEPVHGSAPDIAGKLLADPTAAVLSAALLCRFHWKLPEVAQRIERAIIDSRPKLLRRDSSPFRTQDITKAILDEVRQVSV